MYFICVVYNVMTFMTWHCAPKHARFNILPVQSRWKYQEYCQRENKKTAKHLSGNTCLQELCNLLTWIFFWCLVSILSETTFMIGVHNMSLGVFRNKTVFLVQEDILGQRSSQQLFLTSGVKHGRCSTVCPRHSDKITCKSGLGPNYWPCR